MKKAVTKNNSHSDSAFCQEGDVSKLCDSISITWDNEEKVTNGGGVAYFADYLDTTHFFDMLCADVPVKYTSNNASNVRDVLGTLFLSILGGQWRYAHMNTLRNDKVGCYFLGMEKIVSEDSVRRFLKALCDEDWKGWLYPRERFIWESMLSKEYIVDIDNTVKPIYGHQEGAELGYNPQKPGRPSHNYHTYIIGKTRIVLGVDVHPGDEHSRNYSMPALWEILDALPSSQKPRLIRGDIGYGTESIMLEAESRNQRFLFKIKRTSTVRKEFDDLCKSAQNWSDAGCGWEASETQMTLKGWTKTRKCIFLRRPNKPDTRKVKSPQEQQEFAFVIETNPTREWDYEVLITNDTELTVSELSQLYRDRGDCENVFDEIKNQWGWSGFVTKDIERCKLIARIIALVYNLWNIFARLGNPEIHMEAITSRPALYNVIGRLTQSGRKTFIRLTSNHAEANKIVEILERIRTFCFSLRSAAEQLEREEIWAEILTKAFFIFLGEDKIKPVTTGDQTLLPI